MFLNVNAIVVNCASDLGQFAALSSYNDFGNNLFRDSILVASLNSLTSILAGFVVFCVVGFLARETGTDVKNVR